MLTFKKICNSQLFQNMVVWAIIFCSVLLGVETYYPVDTPAFVVFDVIFSIFFIVEIFIRVLAEPRPFDFFKLFGFKKADDGRYRIQLQENGFWNWFDFLIVVFTSISMFKHLVEHPEFLVVSRLFRVLRILRLLEISDELKAVERKILSIIPTVFSFALLLGILIYIYSIIGIYLFEHKDFGVANFSDLPSAFLTLFQLMTLDGWTEVMNSAGSQNYSTWLTRGFFISFILFTAIISFNVFVAVLTSQVHEKMIKEMEELEEDTEDLARVQTELRSDILKLRKEIYQLRKEIRKDTK